MTTDRQGQVLTSVFRTLVAIVMFLASISLAHAEAEWTFIRARGDELYDGGDVFRFVSFNIPNLHLIEDAYDFDRPNPWRWPDEYEINDALESIRQIGGRVVRTYVISVKRENSNMGEIHHVSGPGEFNEAAFVALDRVLANARKKGVRVILPLVDNWHWWGGVKEYAAFRSKPPEAFWTDSEIRSDFKKTVEFVLTRVNTINGIAYRDDPTILGWETGNELYSPPEWTADIAEFIKSLDEKHLVIDGNSLQGPQRWSIDDPNIDVVTSHHYPNANGKMADAVRTACDFAAGKKPHFVGEFGFVPIEEIETILQTVKESNSSGALLWSLRSHRREGGFYWHSEGAGDNQYKAYHWPGFPSGEVYQETELLTLVRQFAYQINGAEPPRLEPPSAPRLLTIESPSAISWQGSAGASSYSIQRGPSVSGPWETIGHRISDAAVQYRPLFADNPAAQRDWYYRVCAENSGGQSVPSNVEGPVKAKATVIIDEFDRQPPKSQGLIERRCAGSLEWLTKSARVAQEDVHRVSGSVGSTITYELTTPSNRVTLLAFSRDGKPAITVLSSLAGDDFSPIEIQTRSANVAASDYGDWKPVRIEGQPSAGHRFIRIRFTKSRDATGENDSWDHQLSRIEVHCPVP